MQKRQREYITETYIYSYYTGVLIFGGKKFLSVLFLSEGAVLYVLLEKSSLH